MTVTVKEIVTMIAILAVGVMLYLVQLIAFAIGSRFDADGAMQQIFNDDAADEIDETPAIVRKRVGEAPWN